MAFWEDFAPYLRLIGRKAACAALLPACHLPFCANKLLLKARAAHVERPAAPHDLPGPLQVLLDGDAALIAAGGNFLFLDLLQSATRDFVGIHAGAASFEEGGLDLLAAGIQNDSA